jgi:hypothetical protein
LTAAARRRFIENDGSHAIVSGAVMKFRTRGYAVSVDGLQRPISWRQSGPLELALYLPHRLTVERPGR